MSVGIKTKSIVFSVVTVLFAALIATLGAAALMFYQTTSANAERLENALRSVNRQVNEQVDSMRSIFDNFAHDPINNYFIYNSIDISYFLWQDNVSIFKLIEELDLERLYFFYPDGEDAKQVETLRLFYQRGEPLIQQEATDKFVQININRFGAPEVTAVEDSYTFPKEKSGTDWVPWALRNENGALILAARLPLKRLTGEHLGYFILEKKLDLDVQTVGEELGVNITLYDGNGYAGQDGTLMRDLDPALADGGNNRVTPLLDNQNHIYDSMVSIFQYGDIRLGYISVGIPKAATGKKVLNTVLVLLLLGFLITIPIGVTVSIVVSRFVGPIITLTEITKDMAVGNLDRTLEIHDKNEIGQLAKSFSHMRDQIKQKIGELQKMNKELDKRVEVRSAQIAQQDEILNAFIEIVPNPVYFKDVNGVYTRANTLYAQKMGFKTPGKLLGKHDRKISTQTTGRIRSAEDDAVMGSKLTINDAQVSSMNLEGEMIKEWVTKHPLNDSSGNCIGMVCIYKKAKP